MPTWFCSQYQAFEEHIWPRRRKGDAEGEPPLPPYSRLGCLSHEVAWETWCCSWKEGTRRGRSCSVHAQSVCVVILLYLANRKVYHLPPFDPAGRIIAMEFTLMCLHYWRRIPCMPKCLKKEKWVYAMNYSTSSKSHVELLSQFMLITDFSWSSLHTNTCIYHCIRGGIIKKILSF